MARFESGYIFGYRKELNEEIFDNIILWGIWNALLRMATYKPSQILWEGHPRKIPPGSVVFSPKELAARWRLSKSVIIKWLHRLQISGRIVIESCPRGTLITICNWCDFQNSEDEACSQRVHSVLTTSSQRVHNETLSEEDKNERRKEDKKDTHVVPLHKLAVLWNEIVTKPIPKVLKTEGTRLEKCRKLLSDTDDLEHWRMVIQRIEQSDFCKGKGDKGWVATIDWLLKPQTAIKVLEGTYDNRPKGNGIHAITKAQAVSEHNKTLLLKYVSDKDSSNAS